MQSKLNLSEALTAYLLPFSKQSSLRKEIQSEHKNQLVYQNLWQKNCVNLIRQCIGISTLNWQWLGSCPDAIMHPIKYSGRLDENNSHNKRPLVNFLVEVVTEWGERRPYTVSKMLTYDNDYMQEANMPKSVLNSLDVQPNWVSSFWQALTFTAS